MLGENQHFVVLSDGREIMRKNMTGSRWENRPPNSWRGLLHLENPSSYFYLLHDLTICFYQFSPIINFDLKIAL